jgi:hypothetical protein
LTAQNHKKVQQACFNPSPSLEGLLHNFSLPVLFVTIALPQRTCRPANLQAKRLQCVRTPTPEKG